MRHSIRASCVAITTTASVAVLSPTARADIVGVGGSVVLRDPPASILLDQWESDTEIRGWFEREVALSSNLTLGHVNPGFVNDGSQLVSGIVLSGTTVRSYMVRLDAVAQGPATLSGFVLFDTPVLGVFIGSLLGPTDSLLGRPSVVYNTNSFRGLELDASTPEPDSFEISADRFRIDFVMEVTNWTDDIRIVTAVPSPSGVALLGLGGFLFTRRRVARSED